MDDLRTKDGKPIALGVWHNYGGNTSYRASKHGANGVRYSIRLDTTGEVVWPAGPASRDSLMMAMYYERPAHGYATFCFGHKAVDFGDLDKTVS